MLIKIPVSVGELVDKITILEIKKKKIKDKKKLEIYTSCFMNGLLSVKPCKTTNFYKFK